MIPMRRDFHITDKPVIMIIPMIDIMLFLLVFFMISTLYMVQLNSLSVNLPAAAASQRETQPVLVSITVLDSGSVLYDMDSFPEENVGARIAKTLSDNPDAVFVIRGDRRASYEAVVSVLYELKKSGARHVSIATDPKKGT